MAQGAINLVDLTIAEGEEGQERPLIDLLALPQVEKLYLFLEIRPYF